MDLQRNESTRRTGFGALPSFWLGPSVASAVIIATTVGPLTALKARRDATSVPQESVGDHQDPGVRDGGR